MRELTKEQKANLIMASIDAYYTVRITGGSLHICLDDGNWKRSDVEYCEKYAQDNKDYLGVAIAKMLLELPDEVFVNLENDNDLQSSLFAWINS